MKADCVFQIIKVDFLDKVRKQSFLTLVLGVIFVVFNINNQNLILMYNEFTSDFNSGSLSSTIAVIFTTLFLLAGFYLSKGSVEKDRNMKMGDIIAASPLSKIDYILGKWFGNVLVLQFVVLIMFLFSLFIQIINSEMEVSLVQSMLPFLIISIPAMLVVATISILFDIIPVLKNVLGSILYFFIWLFYMGVSISSDNSLGDLSGLRSYWESFGDSIRQVYPDVQYGTSFLFMYEGESIPFAWDGIQFNQSYILDRLIISMILILLCICLSILFFDRFTENYKGSDSDFKIRNRAIIERTEYITKTQLSCLHDNDICFGSIAVFSATFKIIFKMIPAWIWYVETILGIMLFVVQSPNVKHILFSVIFLVPLFFWSKAGLFQSKYGMKELFLCTLFSSVKQLFFILTASVSLTIFLCIGAIAYFVSNYNFWGVVHIIIGSFFSVSFALCVGIMMNKTKLFELCYIFIWYYGILDNSIYQMDFLAVSSNSIVYHYPYLYILYSVAFMGIAIVFLTTGHFREKS